MSATPQQQIDDAIQAVFAKAATDPVFRKLCVSNPRVAIKQAVGIDSPEWLKVKFVDGADADLTFVIPKPASASGELKDEDLERVSGGEAKASGDILQNIKNSQREQELAKLRTGALAGSTTGTTATPATGGDILSVKRSLGGGA